MTKQRRKFTDEFKAEAARLVLEEGMSASQVGRDLGVASSIVCRWVRKAQRAALPKTEAEAGLEELRRLRREVEILRAERDILKKAAAFFAKESL